MRFRFWLKPDETDIPTLTDVDDSSAPVIGDQLSSLDDYHPIRKLPEAAQLNDTYCAARFVSPEARNPNSNVLKRRLKTGNPIDQCNRTPRYLIGENVYCKQHAQILALPIAIQLWRDLDELQSTFNLRWDADMRAIDRWQEAHPEKAEVWPDHADMVVWLMEQLEVIQ